MPSKISRPPAHASSSLECAIAHVARLLPAQGPISVFIHHNTLHAFEDLPFEDAAIAAGLQFGCEPFLAEEAYRAHIARGRIVKRDIDAVVSEALGARGAETLTATSTRADLWRRLVLHGVPEARGSALRWHLDETAVLAQLRPDLPADAVERLSQQARGEPRAARVQALWRACLAAIERSTFAPPQRALTLVRHRDVVLAARDIDVDAWIHPVLIGFTAAYLDQGVARWPMPERELGMYRCFVMLYGRSAARRCGPWAAELAHIIAEDAVAGSGPEASLERSLAALGVPPTRWPQYLAEEALALRGWAGMVRQIEERPDRVPVAPVPARLVDFLAVRLLLTRSALSHVAARHCSDLDAPLAELHTRLAAQITPPPAPTVAERAWPLFHAAQLTGHDARATDALSAGEAGALERELVELDGVARRRLLHLAYERQLRHRFYDALLQHEREPAAASPALQAIFCIDEREESIRRHIEEVDASVETFGVAGFFGAAMYFQGATDAHPRPLCPVAIRPTHYVAETGAPASGWLAALGRLQRRALASFGKNVHLGSGALFRGTAVVALLGALWVIPLVLRVLFPWLTRRAWLARALARGRAPTRLELDRADAVPPIGRHRGFTVDEMADIVAAQLAGIGIVDRMAPLVFVFGHGSTSLNNPHESAHDCGACGGGRGGPNARAFAQMANDTRVRSELAKRDLVLPRQTWFVGGQRDTATNAITLFDEDLVPASQRPLLERARRTFAVARAREAHERCRRFASVASWVPPRMALVHVEARGVDLAQPRPEYGHASNAFAVVGRRARTRGLFLDRRAFLVSYDPSHDAEGQTLATLLAAVVPVMAGINLEYFFGYVDRSGYGSGTKLPHNVTCLLGVMDGTQSDLRTGLPWQMLEIHEPVRLSLVVEARLPTVQRVLREDAKLARLVRNRWIFLACLDPSSDALVEIDGDVTRPHVVEHVLPTLTGTSVAVYGGRRGHLPLTRVVADQRTEHTP